MKSKLNLMILGILLILKSCALTDSVKTLNYEPNVKIESILERTKKVRVEEMKDDRGYDNDKVIFYKKNMYNQTMSGAYVAEKPVSEILTEAIKNGLEQKKVVLDNSGEYVLKSSLQKLDYESISGFSSVRVIPQISVKFQLVDEQGKVVWTDIIIGKANIKGVNFEKFMNPAIDNLVEQLLSNNDFINAIKE